MNLHNRRGVVLVSTMLFLMVVTLMALSSIQTPMTDVHITHNYRLEANAQQIANLSVKMAKNWLLMNHNGSFAPKNEGGNIINSNSENEGTISEFGEYDWKIIRLSGAELNSATYGDTLLSQRISKIKEIETFKKRKYLFEGQSVALDQASAYEEYYYIYGTGRAYLGKGSTSVNTNITANAEAIVSYKQVAPNLN